jgi:phosphatidate cytidylyltransferase
MHQKRWLTALVLVPLVILVILKGGNWGTVSAVLIINVLAHFEFLGFLPNSAGPAGKTGVIALGTLLLLSFSLTACPHGAAVPLLALVVCLFALFLFYLLNYGKTLELGRDLAANTLGLLYVPFLLGHFIWLRLLPHGEWWILWLIAVICSGDTAAYYSGRTWGKGKFYPQVSPGKTWAGTWGGLAANLVVGALLGGLLLPEAGIFSLAVLAVILGAIGVAGDLFESMLKRRARVKDASSLLPGHGGVLDRLDSLLFTVSALVYARLFFLNV